MDFFVTGTNTEVGKTWISQALLLAANRKGLRTLAIKPVAAGCAPSPDGLRNEDGLALQAAMSEKLSYDKVNPLTLEEAIAPHLAAHREGVLLSVDSLGAHCREVLQVPHDLGLVEGAGGWRVPINERETLADLALDLQLPVVMVVGMTLGCLNHALLTAEAIQRDGLRLAGWVANSPGSTMPRLKENLGSLRRLLPAPCLGAVPFLRGKGADQAARYLNLEPLISH